ncbi:MAG: TIGR03016 family PEP-CTERM system-associated outer membrane protein [Nitrospirae bacterium]|nr:TIGR03016 family PEP-CTERM system-associated outer membrane protein [Nitrospirota bacterium]
MRESEVTLPAGSRWMPLARIIIAMTFALLSVVCVEAASDDSGATIAAGPDAVEMADAVMPAIRLDIEEEYNDNIYLVDSGKNSDFITKTSLVFGWKRRDPVWNFDFNYRPSYSYYADNHERDELRHAVTFVGGVAIVRDLLFFDVTDNYQRITLDTRRNTMGVSDFVGQTDANEFVLHPYLKRNLPDLGVVEAGYKYTNAESSEVTATDRQSHVADVKVDLSFGKRLGMEALYRYRKELADNTSYDYDSNYFGMVVDYYFTPAVLAKAGVGVEHIKTDLDTSGQGTLWLGAVGYKPAESRELAYAYEQSYANATTLGVYKIGRHRVALLFGRRAKFHVELESRLEEYLQEERRNRINAMNASMAFTVSRNIEAKITGGYGISEYDPENETVRRFSAEVSGRWNASRYLAFRAMCRHVDDDSNAAGRGFVNNIAMVGVNAEF